MKLGRFSSVGGFFARTLAFFALALTGWYLARDWIVIPTVWISEHAMRIAFTGWVRGTERAGDVLTLVTSLAVAAPDGRLGELAVDVRLLKYCYGMPLLTALLLASWPRGLCWKLPLGLLALLPFQVWGVCADWLLHIAVLSGPVPAAQAGFGPVAANLSGAAYQLGFLVLPTLAPVLVWLALDRKQLATAVLEGTLSGYQGR